MKKIRLVLLGFVILVTGCYKTEPFSAVVSSKPFVNSNDYVSDVLSSNRSTSKSDLVISSYTDTSSITSSIQSSSKASAPVSSSKNEAVEQRRNALEKKFGIQVYYGDEVAWDFEGMTITELREPSYIHQSLDLLDTELSRYPDGFFQDFSRALHINLITNFTDSYAGLATYKNAGKFELYLTTSPYSIQVLHHELMHMIDFTMQEKPGFSAFSDWDSLNPPGFFYTGKDNSSSRYVYGVASSTSDVYFISGYSLKEEFEDRAEIFRIIMANPDSTSFFQNESPLRKKLEYMISEIRRVFPSVQKTQKAAWEIL